MGSNQLENCRQRFMLLKIEYSQDLIGLEGVGGLIDHRKQLIESLEALLPEVEALGHEGEGLHAQILEFLADRQMNASLDLFPEAVFTHPGASFEQKPEHKKKQHTPVPLADLVHEREQKIQAPPPPGLTRRSENKQPVLPPAAGARRRGTRKT